MFYVEIVAKYTRDPLVLIIFFLTKIIEANW